MTTNERHDFACHLGVLAETFGETLTEARLEGYFLGLRDLDLSAVVSAIQCALIACKFFPRPAELRELAGEGFADVGLIESQIVRHLSRVDWPPTSPRDPFLAMVIQRLGGIRAASGMPAGVRLSALKSILPALIPAALARGIAVPRQSSAPLVPIGGGVEPKRITGTDV